MIEAQVIVGGGIAGSVAAAMLARAGLSPLVLERSHGAHHKVCGEFLSWEAADTLRAAGFDVGSLGGSRIDHVRLISGSRIAEAKLPRAATGISRFALDEALLHHASRCGARVERGVHVRSAAPCDDGFALDAGGMVTARTLLLATGKTNLRGLDRKIAARGVTDDLVGFKMHYRLSGVQTARLADAVELHLFGRGGYAGLQGVENGIANLCLLMPKAELPVRGAWDAVLAHVLADSSVLADRLSGAEALFDRPLAISGVPYGWLHSVSAHEPAALKRLGDQFAVVHSFTGDGMAVAAVSGGLAVSAHADFHARLARRVGLPMHVSAALGAGLRRPRLQRAAFAMATVFPHLLRAAAQLTRVAM